jgi:hypothetical protein
MYLLDTTVKSEERKAKTLPYHTRPKQKAWNDELAVMVKEQWFQEAVDAVINTDTDSDNPDLVSSSDDSCPDLLTSSEDDEDDDAADRRDRLSKLRKRANPHTVTFSLVGHAVVGADGLCVESNEHKHSNTQANTPRAVEEQSLSPGTAFGTCKINMSKTKSRGTNQNQEKVANNNDSNSRALVVSATDEVAMVAAGDTNLVVFVLDTGCSQHIFNGKRESMVNFNHKIQRMSTANDKGGLSALGVGDLPVVLTDDMDVDQSIVLKEVLWAPNATASIMSISQAVANGCTQGADDDGAWIRLPPPLSSYILAETQGGLYLIRGVLQIVSAEVISLTTHTKTDTSVEMASALGTSAGRL